MAAAGTAPTFDALDAALAAARPRLGPEDQDVARAVYRLLARGGPVSAEEIGTVSGHDAVSVRELLSGWPGVFTDDAGRVIGFWGLTIVETTHRLTAAGTELFTWCAWDPFFIARIVGPADVATVDPVGGQEIRYRVDEEGAISGLSHPASVLSFLTPSDRWDDDVQTTFCHYVLQFSSRTTASQWCAEHPGTFLLSLGDASRLAARFAARAAGVAL